jgi:hypothetical protein
MSADNYYLIRKHPDGGFVALMGFMSDEDEPQVDPKREYDIYTSPVHALDAVSREYTEYGTQIHPECYVTAPYENFVIGRSREQEPEAEFVEFPLDPEVAEAVKQFYGSGEVGAGFAQMLYFFLRDQGGGSEGSHRNRPGWVLSRRSQDISNDLLRQMSFPPEHKEA